MAVGQHSVAAAPLGVAAGLCFAALLVANYWKNRSHRAACHRDLNLVAVTPDRRAPEDEQVFSLYESVDAEPHAPPMELSRSVLALLESFDVNPVRGESWSRTAATTAVLCSSIHPEPLCIVQQSGE